MDFRKAEFVLSAASPSAFLRDGLPQIAFAGRSNVGKSSVINCLTARKNFARVGSTPGKTAHINYFRIDGRAYIADLPGYGYAKVPPEEKARWAALMESYFASGLVSLGVLVVDARHAPTADDAGMMKWFADSGRPVIIAANKLDKLRKSETERNLGVVKETLGSGGAQVVPFSAENGTGRAELIRAIESAM
jgi:GTP-binding protein